MFLKRLADDAKPGFKVIDSFPHCLIRFSTAREILKIFVLRVCVLIS